MRWSALLFASLAFAPAACRREPAASPPVRVAAAADLAFALREVAALFERETGLKAELTFGSTGLLARQLAEGAPFDLFAAANASFADEAARSGACDAATQRLYARGRIVIWTEASLQAPRSLAELAAPRFRKIAIANPEHAPYGRAALQALERSAALSAVQPKLVYGENVQQALQYAKTGNADAAIVALSLATSTPGGVSLPIDAALHDPIDQALIVCNRGQARTAALRLSDLIGSPRGRAILLAHGFSLPGESSTGSIPAAPEAGAR